jgi:spermidine/putrescine-binding protein
MMTQMLRIAAFGLLGLALFAVACDGDGATRYRVTVGFRGSYTQANVDEVNAFLRAFDEDLDFLLQESFPPTGVATVETDESNFCATVESELTAKPYVRDVTCTDISDETPVSSPDEPVQSTPY